ncbi:MAG: aldo/keto reductase, partial [Cyanobacteria bacterium P01_D01_bin.44]
LVTGKYSLENYQKPTGARSLDPKFSKNGLEKIAPVIEVLKQVGIAHERTPAQVALNWLIGQGNVVPIPGAKNAGQATQNAGALGWELSLAERGEIDQVTQAWLS